MWNARLEARAAEMRARICTTIKIIGPPCPDCGAPSKGKGFSEKGKGFSEKGSRRRFKCTECERCFTPSKPVRSVRVKANFGLMCYRCGSLDVSNVGPHGMRGRQGYCPSCKKHFYQGGHEEMDRNGLLLRERVELLRLPPEIAAEVLQQASMMVLEGRGYCWTVELDISAAFKATRGEFGQRGSDHPAYRMHNGQPALDR